MLVTAFETIPEVPKMEVVTERLLHKEKKIIEKGNINNIREGAALLGNQRSRNNKKPKCY